MIEPISATILSLVYLKLRYIIETPEEEVSIPVLDNTNSYMLLRECVRAGIYDKDVYRNLGIKNIVVATFLPELRKEFPKDKPKPLTWEERREQKNKAKALLIANIEREYADYDTTPSSEIIEAKQSVHDYFYHRGD